MCGIKICQCPAGGPRLAVFKVAAVQMLNLRRECSVQNFFSTLRLSLSDRVSISMIYFPYIGSIVMMATDGRTSVTNQFDTWRLITGHDQPMPRSNATIVTKLQIISDYAKMSNVLDSPLIGCDISNSVYLMVTRSILIK